MLLAVVVVASCALRIAANLPLPPHAVEAFSVFRYAGGVHDVRLNFTTTDTELQRVDARLACSGPMYTEHDRDVHVKVHGVARTRERAIDVCSASALYALTLIRRVPARY